MATTKTIWNDKSTVIKRTRFEFMWMPVKGENYRKVVLTCRTNKPIMIRARVAFMCMLCVFNGFIYAHASNYVIKRSCETKSSTRKCRTHKRYDNHFWRLHIFWCSIYDEFNAYIFLLEFSTLFSFDLTSKQLKPKKLSRTFTISDSSIFIFARKIEEER